MCKPRVVLLREGHRPASSDQAEEEKTFEMLGLIGGTKPVLYVSNVEEASADAGNDFSALVFERAKAEGAQAVSSPPRSRGEIAVLPEGKQADYLEAVGLAEPGLKPRHPRRLTAARAPHLLHGGPPKEGPRLDHRARHPARLRPPA